MRDKGYFFCIGLSFLFILLPHTTQAKVIIWQIGRTAYKENNEFSWPPEEEVKSYIVPSHWRELLTTDDPDWQGFPQHLYTSYNNDQANHPERLQEIRINFPYSSDYHNPFLAIRAVAWAMNPNENFFLEILKFNKKIPISLREMDYGVYDKHEFAVGLIKGGDIDEKNEIIIKCNGPSDGYIVFDALYLYYDDTDSDYDGVCDRDEGDACLDSRTTSILKVGRDPAFKTRFTLHINEPEDKTPHLREVRFVDPNILAIPGQLESSYYFPHGFLGFKLDDIEPGTQATIQISYESMFKEELSPESVFYSTLCCYNYHTADGWQEVSFSFLDSNTIMLKVGEGGEKGHDEEESGTIDTILAFAYPQKLDVNVDKRGCFLESLAVRSKK